MASRTFDTQRLHYFLTRRPTVCTKHRKVMESYLFCAIHTLACARAPGIIFSVSLVLIVISPLICTHPIIYYTLTAHTHTRTSLVFFHFSMATTRTQLHQVNQYKQIKRADTWVAAYYSLVSQHFSSLFRFFSLFRFLDDVQFIFAS